MKLYLIFLAICGMSNLFVGAMHGGKIVRVEQVPYMAELVKYYGNGAKSFCGAAILSERWVLTAAHCLRNQDETFKDVRVKAQTTIGSDGELHNISKILSYAPFLMENRWKNDISLIELSDAIKFDEKSRPISISKNPPKVGNVIVTSGYGDDYEIYGTELQLGRQNVISRRECRNALKNTPQGKIPIDDRAFCTDSSILDLCYGDSGSPGVLDGKLVGVAADGCESPLPNIFVNVAYYYDWIVEVTGIKFD